MLFVFWERNMIAGAPTHKRVTVFAIQGFEFNFHKTYESLLFAKGAEGNKIN